MVAGGTGVETAAVTEATASEISRKPRTFLHLNTETAMKELEVRGQSLRVIFCSLPESPWVQLKGNIKASFFFA